MFHFLIALLIPAALFSATVNCPSTSLIDQEIVISVTNLPPKTSVTLELTFTDSKDRLWKSEAIYLSSCSGSSRFKNSITYLRKL